MNSTREKGDYSEDGERELTKMLAGSTLSLSLSLSHLVREDIFNLSQLLIEGGRPGNGRDVLRGIVHLTVPVN